MFYVNFIQAQEKRLQAELLDLQRTKSDRDTLSHVLHFAVSRIFALASLAWLYEEHEFDEFVKKTKDESLDNRYRKVKSIWKKYVDADDFHISICAADTIFTYFQDKIGLTHYLFFVGDNSSDKSNNVTVLHYIAYRNMMSSGMTAPNVYQFLGSDEEGIGTICEDQADNIDEELWRELQVSKASIV